MCSSDPTLCTGASTSKIALGEINGVKPSAKTIEAQLPGSTTIPFPGDTCLYNVYSDGSNPDIPASAPAALNVASEDGFLCKPSTASTSIPTPGRPTGREINAAITAQGFFPLPLRSRTARVPPPGSTARPGRVSRTRPGVTA